MTQRQTCPDPVLRMHDAACLGPPAAVRVTAYPPTSATGFWQYASRSACSAHPMLLLAFCRAPPSRVCGSGRRPPFATSRADTTAEIDLQPFLDARAFLPAMEVHLGMASQSPQHAHAGNVCRHMVSKGCMQLAVFSGTSIRRYNYPKVPGQRPHDLLCISLSTILRSR